MPALEDVAEAVHQQEVAQLPVKPAASHGAQRVEGQVRDLGRVLALPHEVLHGEAEAQLVQGGGDVLTQRVVHVKPIAGNVLQPQLPADTTSPTWKLSEQLTAHLLQ